MGNLVLSNPSEPYETQQAIVTAIHEDEAVLAAQGEAIAALEAAALTIAVNGIEVATAGAS